MTVADTVKNLYHRRPGPTLITLAFAGSAVLTIAYFAGLVPGIPKTLPTFVRVTMVTITLFAVTLIAWVLSFTNDVLID